MQTALQRQLVVPFRHVLGEVAQQAPARRPRQAKTASRAPRPRQGRSLDHQTETRKFVGTRGQPRGIGLIELDDLRDQQDLPRDAGLSIAAFMRS